MDPSVERAIEDAARFQKMDNETARREILKFERQADEGLADGSITQEQAWDIYFLLLHECDERGLTDDRYRIVGKIDIKQYNPFSSPDPGVRFTAQLRARGMGLVKNELN